jgi:hypothetical protein
MGEKDEMSVVFILLALSAVVGLALSSFGWRSLIVASLILAVLSATVLQIEGFGTIPGVAIIAVCLTLNQVAYLIGFARSGLHNISGKGQQKQRAPSRFF